MSFARSILLGLVLSIFLGAGILPVEAQSRLGGSALDSEVEFLTSTGRSTHDTCTDRPRTFAQLVGYLICLINRVIPLLIGVALLLFFVGVIRYIISAGEDGKVKAKATIVWGIITLFVMVSVFGILKILMNSFGV